MKKVHLTKHAVQRAKERGLSPALVRFIAKHADVEKPARDGRRALIVSQATADVLGALGLQPSVLELVRTCVIIEAKGVVITVHDGARDGRSFQ